MLRSFRLPRCSSCSLAPSSPISPRIATFRPSASASTKQRGLHRNRIGIVAVINDRIVICLNRYETVPLPAAGSRFRPESVSVSGHTAGRPRYRPAHLIPYEAPESVSLPQSCPAVCGFGRKSRVSPCGLHMICPDAILFFKAKEYRADPFYFLNRRKLIVFPVQNNVPILRQKIKNFRFCRNTPSRSPKNSRWHCPIFVITHVSGFAISAVMHLHQND